MAAFRQRTRRPGPKAPLLVIASFVPLLLVACGGGDDPPIPTATFPPQIAATQPLLQTTPTPAATEEVNGVQEYVVQAGDTLGAIAEQFGVTVDAIIAANELANPDLIQPGDTLTIPAAE
ncbi:MAG TPA: LysM domain-containing protein [Dehalococcoidia bacterium]|nr:LysM domain-containing protein [Dehalococcoidia bacterium]